MSDDVMSDAIVPEKSTYGKDSDPGPGLGPEQWPEGSLQRIINVGHRTSFGRASVCSATTLVRC